MPLIEAAAAMLPYKAPTTGPLADAVRSAMKFAFGREPVFVREGGSIGAVVSMENLLEAPVMFLGLSLPEHGYHAPNENYDWEQASGGMVAFAKYFEEVAGLGKNGGDSVAPAAPAPAARARRATSRSSRSRSRS